MSANFKTDWVENYIFCSNIKRLDRLKKLIHDGANNIRNTAEDDNAVVSAENHLFCEKVILAAYLDTNSFETSPRVNTNELGWFGNIFWDNCMLMLIHLLKKIGVTEIYLAGWDGFTRGSNFVDESMESIYHYEEENSKVTDIIGSSFREMKLNFLTPSVYQ